MRNAVKTAAFFARQGSQQMFFCFKQRTLLSIGAAVCTLGKAGGFSASMISLEMTLRLWRLITALTVQKMLLVLAFFLRTNVLQVSVFFQ